MNRREFLWAAAMLSAGVSAKNHGISMTEEQKRFLLERADYIERSSLVFFSEAERNAVTTVAELIIPRTDTPGAQDAGVPRFIELMVGDWFSEAERSAFMSGLSNLLSRAEGDFNCLPAVKQIELLNILEDEASDSPWYISGNKMRLSDASAPFICQIKELTVLGFMLSSVGASQFLTFNPMGAFDGDVPLQNVASSYATNKPLRTMFK